jgi:hypothetical protein
MLRRIIEHFLYHPRQLVKLGGHITSLGCIYSVFGFFGQVATKIPGLLSQPSKQPIADKSLADIYPTLPTWWIPESAYGWMLAVSIVAIGLWLTVIGKHLNRVYEH